MHKWAGYTTRKVLLLLFLGGGWWVENEKRGFGSGETKKVENPTTRVQKVATVRIFQLEHFAPTACSVDSGVPGRIFSLNFRSERVTQQPPFLPPPSA